MSTHLSTRLVWHDRAWDGHVCDHPSKNAYCMVQQHIRDGRDDKREDAAVGHWLADLKTWQPPCSRDPIEFSPRGYTITHNDPLEFRRLPSAKKEIAPYSTCPSHKQAWEHEEHWYEDNDYLDQVITFEEGAASIIDAAEIERIARNTILMEG